MRRRCPADQAASFFVFGRASARRQAGEIAETPPGLSAALLRGAQLTD
jgi:hypothetical protein